VMRFKMIKTRHGGATAASYRQEQTATVGAHSSPKTGAALKKIRPAFRGSLESRPLPITRACEVKI
jgi:hypothetical protein